jgi:hypothetical protein
MLTDIDRAYMAGLVDGEGSIHIVMMNRKSISVQPRVCIAMSELDCVRWAFRTFEGGRLYLNLAQTQINGCNRNAKSLNRVDWTGTTCEPLLREIYPFLKLKQPQAELIFKLRSLIGPRGNKRSPELISQLLVCYERCHELNKRGLAA